MLKTIRGRAFHTSKSSLHYRYISSGHTVIYGAFCRAGVLWRDNDVDSERLLLNVPTQLHN